MDCPCYVNRITNLFSQKSLIKPNLLIHHPLSYRLRTCIWLAGGKGFFMTCAGETLVKKSRSSGTFSTGTVPTWSGSYSSPRLSKLGCWKTDILVPWKDMCSVVAVWFWSMLCSADCVKRCFLNTGGHTTISGKQQHNQVGQIFLEP